MDKRNLVNIGYWGCKIRLRGKLKGYSLSNVSVLPSKWTSCLIVPFHLLKYKL